MIIDMVQVGEKMTALAGRLVTGCAGAYVGRRTPSDFLLEILIRRPELSEYRISISNMYLPSAPY